MQNQFKQLCKMTAIWTVLMSTLSFGALIGGNKVMASNRNDAACRSMEQLYNNPQQRIVADDNELNSIMTKFIYADINAQSKLPVWSKELLKLAVLTANNTPEEIPLHVQGALKAGATPTQIRETIIHTLPYVGMSRVQPALKAMYKAFKDNDVKLPLANNGTVTDETRHEAGLAVQKEIFGSAIDKMNASAPADQKHINYNLSANCFGDFYTRKGLDLKERELITFTAIIAMGGCDPQAKAHVSGNLAVGNTRQQLLDAVTIALPYIGYPKTLNAIAAINSIVPAKEE